MRVTGGRLRGRRIHGTAGRATRPTSERARVGLFDWLGPRVEGRVVLDLFAGTGALGIEALSRGAASVVFVESARPALRALRRSCSELELEAETRILASSAAAAVSRLRREGLRFDLVLADPPYGRDGRARLAKQADLLDILAPDAILLIERSRRDEPLVAESPLVARGPRSYGETTFDWYDWAPAEQGGAE